LRSCDCCCIWGDTLEVVLEEADHLSASILYCIVTSIQCKV